MSRKTEGRLEEGRQEGEIEARVREGRVRGDRQKQVRGRNTNEEVTLYLITVLNT